MPAYRLSALYGSFFIILGAWMHYLGRFMDSLGYSGAFVGIITATLTTTKIVVPFFWAMAADHFQARLGVMRYGAAIAALAVTGIFFHDSPWQLFFLILLFGIGNHAILPQTESVTLSYLAHAKDGHYSHIRVWGSVSFILAAIATGALAEHVSVWGMWALVLAGLILVFLFSLTLAEPKAESSTQGTQARSVPLWSVIRQPRVLAFLGSCALLQAGCAVYYVFFDLSLKQYGYPAWSSGAFIGLGVLAEVILFIMLPRWSGRFSARNILLFSLVVTVFRWSLTAFTLSWPVVLFFLQLLHAFTYAAAHSASMALLQQWFDDEHRSRAQALYGSLGFGGGLAAGSLTAGYLWDWSGQLPAAVFTWAAIVTIPAAVLVWCCIPSRTES